MANFRTLQSFLDQENRVAKLFGGKEYPMNVRALTQAQADELFQKLDANMSPENLHMDGEITAAQARKRARLFTGAYEDLKKLGFVPTGRMYCLTD